MSGLVAILQRDRAPIDPGQLRMLLDVAPFGATCVVWTDGAIGLGVSALRQPASSRSTHPPSHDRFCVDDRTVVVFDGRLDDRASLRARLDDDPTRDDTAAGDAELVAAAYERWGADCAGHLLGDFSFCLWDRQRRRLIAARDHFGVKPLYVSTRGHTLILSNVLRAVRRHPLVSDRLDDRAIGDFLLFGLSMDESRTSFADVGRVPPAHVLAASLETPVRIARYWRFERLEPLAYQQRHAAVDEFADLLRQAVGDRLRGGAAGVLMSGGLDSSSIAATAADLLGSSAATNLRAFTGIYDTVPEDEERYYSTLVAATLNIGIDHHSFDRYRLFDRWGAGQLPPEPISEPMIAGTADLLGRAAAHSGFVLTGDGGDPLLLPSTLVSQIWRVPLFPLVAGVASTIRRGGRPPLGIGAAVRRWRHSIDDRLPAWLADPLLRTCDPRARCAEVAARRSIHVGDRSEAVNSILDPWWPSTFETYDPGATGQPVDIRYPFFDRRLVTFAMRVPSFPLCVNKHLLRSALRGRLLDVIRLRPKTPLATAASALQSGWSMAEAVRAIDGVAGMEQYVDARKFEASVRHKLLFTHHARGTIEAVTLAVWLRHSSSAMAIA